MLWASEAPQHLSAHLRRWQPQQPDWDVAQRGGQMCPGHQAPAPAPLRPGPGRCSPAPARPDPLPIREPRGPQASCALRATEQLCPSRDRGAHLWAEGTAQPQEPQGPQMLQGSPKRSKGSGGWSAVVWPLPGSPELLAQCSERTRIPLAAQARGSCLPMRGVPPRQEPSMKGPPIILVASQNLWKWVNEQGMSREV